MGTNLTGDDARIWGLHAQGFSVSRIAGLVGAADSHVRAVIAGEWRAEKLKAKGAKKSRGARC